MLRKRFLTIVDKVGITMIKRRYGWIPDLPDTRDLSYKAVAPKIMKLPDKVDLREWCSPVEDQGSLGSCTANACAGNLELLERKGIDPVPEDPITPSLTLWQRILRFFGLYKPTNTLGSGLFKDTSRLFIYYNARSLIGTTAEDSGAYIRDCMKTLAREGHCLEKLWPYNLGMAFTRPNSAAYADGHNHVITNYMRIDTINDMLTCLADGYPVVIGITLYESFESDEVRRTGVVNMPGSYERVIGGHAVLVVGYDQSTKRLLVRNSWGPNWGQNGYFTIPYEYVEKLGADFWTIRKGNGHVS
jgi:C1A family cysteine protease